MKASDIKIIEEWYDVKVETFIIEFKQYYKENANLELHTQTLNNLNIALNNTLVFEDENKNKITKEELAYLKEKDSYLPKLGGLMALIGFGAQDYWACPTLAYSINNKTLYKTQEYLNIEYKIQDLQPLIEISKLTIEEYTERELNRKLMSSKTYTMELNRLYNKIHYYIDNLVDDYTSEHDCGCCYEDKPEYLQYFKNRKQKIKEELNKTSVMEEIQKIYDNGLLKITKKWSKYGYGNDQLNANDIVSNYLKN